MAGLTAAYRLEEQGFAVTVLEASDHVGGKTAASRHDGFCLNTGATFLGGSYDTMRRLAKDVGVADRMTRTVPTIGIVGGNTVHWLRGGPITGLIDFAKTDLIGWRSKLLLGRLVADGLKARRKAGYDRPQLRAELDTESIAQYCERRLNPELRDRLIAPLVGGLFGWSGETSSIADLYFTLFKILGSGGLAYEGGIDFLARATAARLDVRTDARVTRLDCDPDGVDVTWTGDGGTHAERVAGVISTLPAPLVPAIFPGLDPRLRELLEDMPQANLMSVRFALNHPPDRDADLVIAPEGDLGGVATVIFEHRVARGAAPAGKGIVAVLMYDRWVTAHLDDRDDSIIASVLPPLDLVVPGIAEMVDFAEVTKWHPGAVHTAAGVHQRAAAIDRLCDCGQRVQLAGDYLSLPSINGTMVTGEAAARRLAHTIAAQPAWPSSTRSRPAAFRS
jgi:protoporphyrinogen/coproporphyrinogen III oxidase